jgi:hypothetical protein
MNEIEKCIRKFQKINAISLRDLHLNLKNYEASSDSFHKILFDSDSTVTIGDFKSSYRLFMSPESSKETKEQYAIQAATLIRLIIEKSDASEKEKKSMFEKIYDLSVVGPEESAEVEHYQAMEEYYNEVLRLQRNLRKLIHKSCNKEIIVAFDLYVSEVGVQDDFTGI